ncbi:NAD dependent epimerase/dehydratase [Aspergillus bombycis]|uniref:NAD dependent epimerase/dehydratase n=1 Tax=Aspergillus bombycis TaxID=109264 RepID=A0A1F8AA71_9EURO|nr:NAD dependent epimerase/dehydratase [Aspergillus bombycis]OGM48275.1 NAD dependent epimerase/dehydratase [Aspergillus bombycis]
MVANAKKQHVLLTGANGFIASHILSILLERGYAITATVRSQEKAAAIIRTHPSWEGRITFAIVPDFTGRKPFDELFRNAEVPFTFVIHAASPVTLQADDMQKSVIEPAVLGVTELLGSAQRYGGIDLRRFVLLSSAVTVLNSYEDIARPGRPYTEDNWNHVTAQQAVERRDAALGYTVSKIQSERAAWEFMKTNSPAFDLTVMNPHFTTGPMIHPISGISSINITNYLVIANLIDGVHRDGFSDVHFPHYHFVDVRDVARSHVDALTNPAAAGRRVLLVAELLTPQLVVNIIRKHFPSLRERVLEGNPAQTLPYGVRPTGWDTRISQDILAKGAVDGQWSYIGREKSVIDTVQCMIDSNVI